MAAAIQLDSIHKKFGAVTALRGLSVRVPQGVIYGVLGPNGSGKTTAIRILAGTVAPDRGSATVLGHPAGSAAARAQIGYMPQLPALYDELSIRANVRFFAALTLDAPDAAVGHALELVGLSERADDPVHTLSGGLTQRTSLACAIVHSPRILLLDEPTVGVDPELRTTFWSHFRDLADRGTTILVSSHVMDEASRTDRLGLMRSGSLLREGTAASLQSETGEASLEEAFLALARTDDAAR